MSSLLLHHGRDRHVIHLPKDCSISMVQETIERVTSVPRCQQTLLSHGKRLGPDDSITGVKKLMLLKKPAFGSSSSSSNSSISSAVGSNASAAAPKRLFTLRCLVTGRVVRDMPLSTSAKVSTVIETASRALGIPPAPDGQRLALFSRKGKQILRPDLTLGDYAAGIFAEGGQATELFVHPQSNPATLLAQSETSAIAAAAIDKAVLGQLVVQMNDVSPHAPLAGGGLPPSAVDLPGVLPFELLQSLEEQLHSEVNAQMKRAAADAEREEEARLEAMCARMCDALLPDASTIAQSASPPSGRQGRRRKAEEDSARAPSQGSSSSSSSKRDAAGWGNGLAKGFLSRPKRKAAPTLVRAAAVSSKSDHASGASAAKDKENFVHDGGVAAAHGKVQNSKRGDRCACCDVRLPITACVQSTCKCGVMFCAAHLQNHTCAFDHKAAARRTLNKANPLIAADKV
jgi:hypothetical protein